MTGCGTDRSARSSVETTADVPLQLLLLLLMLLMAVSPVVSNSAADRFTDGLLLSSPRLAEDMIVFAGKSGVAELG